ncbi:S-adenosyl-L-methionine-dependent methyltransferase [Neoconidiobolus thromboides FSU 785]|nr:S-adenosyl-L-methionine-dependent methyltransferase [Neoconidiobolus thromboides FSU 785]
MTSRETNLLLQSEKLRSFLLQNEIDIKEYDPAVLSHRYLRVRKHIKINQDKDKKESQPDILNLHLLKTELNESPIIVIQAHFHFLKLPKTLKLNLTTAYQSNQIIGMDISSAISVLALDTQSTDRVLDLCCAPGMKLLMIAELLEEGNITGVDISKSRLSTCRALVKKYQVANKVKLYYGDGTIFRVLAGVNSRWLTKEQKEWYSLNSDDLGKPFYAPKEMRGFNLLFEDENEMDKNKMELLYDKVLVDAECTHDGSIVHVEKYQQEKEGFTLEQLEDKLSVELSHKKSELQLQLLVNGYKLLKKGGTIVYSTCSFTRQQNEYVIAKFLNLIKFELLMEPPIINSIQRFVPKSIPYLKGKNIDEEFIAKNNINLESTIINRYLSNAIRFLPSVSNTSGLFIISFKKV